MEVSHGKINSYEKRGVSSQKEDVVKAVKNLDGGLFPNAFCKAIANPFQFAKNFQSLSQDSLFLSHADGVGSKSALAYLYWKESGDLSVFRNLSQDSMVMNTDDLLCVGCVDDFFFSSTIARNKHRIPGEVLNAIIEGSKIFLEKLNSWGINSDLMGGETADLGDLVRTLAVDMNACTFIDREKFIDSNKITPGLVILGLSSSGQTNYEDEYNSGIASNGLTSARHDLLNLVYRESYPETYDNLTPKEFIYSGDYLIGDALKGTSMNIGKALLSPTRTYLPVIKKILHHYPNQIKSILHLTGGGQTKCLKFGSKIKYIKDNLFPLPPIFKIISESKHYREFPDEIYKVFNCGHRLELYINEDLAPALIDICKDFKLSAQVIGYTESSLNKNQLFIKNVDRSIEF